MAAENSTKLLIYEQPEFLAQVNYDNLITLIGFVFFEAVLLVSLYIPISLLRGVQELLLAATSNFYFFFHLLSFTFLPFFVSAAVSFIFFFAVIVFARNEKLYNLFCATGIAYIISYMLVILFKVSSFLFLAVFFLLPFVGLVILKKAKRELHHATCKAVLTGFMLNILIGNLFPIDFMQNTHVSNSMGYFNNLLTVIVFVIGGGLAFVWCVYKDKVMERIKSMRGEGKKEEVKEEKKEKEEVKEEKK